MAVVDIVRGNLVTLAIVGVLYLIYQIVASYCFVCIYAVLLSEALQRPKNCLVRVTRGWVSHSSTTAVLMLGALGIGAVLLIAMLVLSVQDLLSVQRTVAISLRQDVTLGLNWSTLESWGAPQVMNSTLAYAQGHIVNLEAQYNMTPWWPMVADTVAWLRFLQVGNFTHTECEVDVGAADELSCLVNEGWSELPSFKEQLSKLWRAQFQSEQFMNQLWATLRLGQEELLTVAFSVARVGRVFVLSILSYCASSLINVVFFFSLTLTLLSEENSLLQEFVAGISGQWGKKVNVEANLRTVIEGVFFFPFVCYLVRYFYTLTVAFFTLPFPFLLASLTLAQTLLPGISSYPWLACVPWVLHLVYRGILQSSCWDLTLAASLSISQFFVLGQLEDWAAQRSFKVRSWVTGLSVVCGFERFGLHAFFLGPLVVSLAWLSFTLISEGANEDDDGTDEDGEDGADPAVGIAEGAGAAGAADAADLGGAARASVSASLEMPERGWSLRRRKSRPSWAPSGALEGPECRGRFEGRLASSRPRRQSTTRDFGEQLNRALSSRVNLY